MSENARFADLCEKCKIAFIGPSASIINRMGNKSEARKTMMEAGDQYFFKHRSTSCLTNHKCQFCQNSHFALIIGSDRLTDSHWTLPHRHPFLLIDTIEELEPGVRAVGYKSITYNESQFAGHFPQEPVKRILISFTLSASTKHTRFFN